MEANSRIKNTLKGLAIVISLFILVIIFNILRNSSHQLTVEAIQSPEIEPQSIVNILAQAIRFQTVSQRNLTAIDYSQYVAFREYLQTIFPIVYQTLTYETVNEHSLLFTWQGQDSTLPPILFTAHYDVVSADPNSANHWTHPPFSGTISDGFVWGRGAMDDKAAIITQLFALQTLIQQNFQPKRTLLFAYGHDEEIGGEQGAVKISELLASRGYQPAWLIDEGMPITQGVLQGIENPVALIAIAEKGYLTLKLQVMSDGGHSSSPPPHSAVGILAKAITQLEANPLPARLNGPVGDMFDTLAPEMSWRQKIVLNNRWLFSGILEKQLSAKHSTNALIRTTTAATMFEGSPQANVLPTQAIARINFRLIPGDNTEKVIDHVRAIINDELVHISQEGKAIKPSSVSSTHSEGFRAITTTVREIFPSTLTAPALLIASTDSRHYASLVNNTYRFRPLQVTPDDIKRFHGVNERIAHDNLLAMTKFQIRLIQNINGY